MKPIYTDTCKLTDYKPIYKIGDKYAVCFNCKTIKSVQKRNTIMTVNDHYEVCQYKYMVFNAKPSIQTIKNEYENYVNSIVTKRIKTGFIYDGKNIDLSNENQMNYKAAYDLALQTNGMNLPYKIKCRKNNKTQYLIFNGVNELTTFYLAVNKHINKCLEEGWNMKDSIDYSIYV